MTLGEKNPLPDRGIDPASAACRSDALPTELHPRSQMTRPFSELLKSLLVPAGTKDLSLALRAERTLVYSESLAALSIHIRSRVRVGCSEQVCIPVAVLGIERLRVRIPAEAAGEFSSPESASCADSYSVSVSPPCYRSGTYKTPVILPKVQVASFT